MLYKKGAETMNIEHITSIKRNRQDGAVFGGYLFSFDHLGVCTVYQTESLKAGKEAEAFSEFTLDKTGIFMPHSNAVTFGTEYFAENDEFPLLYTNAYNTYAKSENPMHGVLGVYRITRKNSTFRGELVQLIEIGFTKDSTLWKSETAEDVRPYGNFAVDREQNKLYAFTMRDETKTTRYFAFDLPKAADGDFCEPFGVNKVVLEKEDILDFFDCDYHNFVQGACIHDGKLYSLEGFSDDVNIPPAVRIMDLKEKKQIEYIRFGEYGLNTEPELIDFENGICFYAENGGNLYRLSF